MNPFTALALGLIRAYQRWVSPYKGFACAHRVHRGGPSCSVVGAQVVRSLLSIKMARRFEGWAVLFRQIVG